MSYPVVGVVLGFVLTLVWFVVLVLVDLYRELRAPAVVTCPAVGSQAAVQLQPVEDRPRRIAGCSRWPTHGGCNQACVEQIAPLGAGGMYHSKT